MTNRFPQTRKHFHPRDVFSARGQGRPMRASDVILCFTLMMLSVALLASLVIHLFAA